MPVAPALGTAVGTVEGCRAVFHVAVVGYGVVATVGDVVAYGVGPGTGRSDQPLLTLPTEGSWDSGGGDTYCRRS